MTSLKKTNIKAWLESEGYEIDSIAVFMKDSHFFQVTSIWAIATTREHISIFIIIIVQITISNVQGVAPNKKPTENYEAVFPPQL